MEQTRPGGLLTLDLATCSGFAYGYPGEQPKYGSFQLSSAQGEGRLFLSFERWLKAMLREWQPKVMVYEAPILPRAGTSFQTATRLIGLGVLAEKVGTEMEVPLVERANNATVKKWISGHGRSGKSSIQSVVEAYGWRPKDDNASDALAIFLWAEARHAPNVTRGLNGPLFAAAAR